MPKEKIPVPRISQSISDEEINDIKRQMRGRYRHSVGPQLVEAILHRLEAAEKVHWETCKRIMGYGKSGNSAPFDKEWFDADLAWRKSKGEPPGDVAIRRIKELGK